MLLIPQKNMSIEEYKNIVNKYIEKFDNKISIKKLEKMVL